MRYHRFRVRFFPGREHFGAPHQVNQRAISGLPTALVQCPWPDSSFGTMRNQLNEPSRRSFSTDWTFAKWHAEGQRLLLSVNLNGRMARRRNEVHDVRINLNSQLVRTAFSCAIRCVRCNVQ
jgi:hypothetical protein